MIINKATLDQAREARANRTKPDFSDPTLETQDLITTYKFWDSATGESEERTHALAQIEDALEARGYLRSKIRELGKRFN
jgi:hypothetical protein